MVECGPWACSPGIMRLAQMFLVLAAVVGFGFMAVAFLEWRRARDTRLDSIRLLRAAQEHLRDIERQAGLPSSFDDDATPPDRQVH
jgi:Tfp pilus assembly protein PilX